MNVTKKWYRIPIPYVSIAYMLHGYEYVKYYVHEKEWFDDMQEDEPEFESTTWSEYWPVVDTPMGFAQAWLSSTYAGQ